jgi:hypothetical protein
MKELERSNSTQHLEVRLNQLKPYRAQNHRNQNGRSYNLKSGRGVATELWPLDFKNLIIYSKEAPESHKVKTKVSFSYEGLLAAWKTWVG